MAKKIGLAVIGFGRAGYIHAENILTNRRTTLRYIVDIDPAKEVDVRHFYGDDVVFTTDLESVLQDPNVDGVVITTATPTHQEVVEACCKARKPMMCEKPIGRTEEEIINCYLAAEREGIPLFCLFNRRFDPYYHEVKQRYQEGEVGKARIIRTSSRDNPRPSIEYLKTSGGFFHDSGVHDFDLIRWVADEDPIEVYSVASAFDKELEAIGDVDTIAVTLRFPSGLMSITDLQRESVYGYDQRLEVYGEKGMLQANNMNESTVTLSNEAGQHGSKIKNSFMQRFDLSYKQELTHFINVLEGKEKLSVSLKDCIAAGRIADAAEVSAKTGKPVRLNLELEVRN